MHLIGNTRILLELSKALCCHTSASAAECRLSANYPLEWNNTVIGDVVISFRSLSLLDLVTDIDQIYLPETVFDIDVFLAKVEHLAATKRSVVIAVSEGYTAMASCKNGIESVRKNAAEGNIEKADK